MPENSVFLKNMEALKRHRPEIARLIEQTSESQAISSFKTSEGETDLACHFADGKFTPYYNTPSPEKFSKNLLQSFEFKNPRILFFLGMGLGLHLLEYAKTPHPLNQTLVIIEAFPQVFKKAIETTNLVSLFENKKVHWFVGTDPLTFKMFLNHFFSQGSWLRYANAIQYFPLPPAVHLTPQFYEEVEKIVPQAIGHQFNRIFSDPYDSFRGLENIFKNLPTLLTIPSLEQARKVFSEIPGILLASGPSLAQSLPYIKEMQDRALLIACPSALPLLLREGIHPHLWLNIERNEEQGLFLENLPPTSQHIFVAPPWVHPRCFKTQGAIHAYILGQSLSCSWLPLEGTPVDLGHSSAHAAFQILQLLGCRSIFLVGQDLCYQGEKSHAAGVWEESQVLMHQLQASDQKRVLVEGNNGKPVQSNLFWHTYLKTFSETLLPNYSGKVYNVIPAQEGAKIQGTERIDPESLTNYLPHALPSDPFSILKNCLTPPSEGLQTNKKKITSEQTQKIFQMLARLAEDSGQFALECKRLQFKDAIVNGHAEEGKKIYSQFQEKLEHYSARYSKDPEYQEDQEVYSRFFHPLIQGVHLQLQMHYFSNDQDLYGNFQEISRKLEILFQMAKEESFWAERCLHLLKKEEEVF